MRQKSGPVKESAEKVVKDIRRATRRHFSAVEEIRIVLEGLRGEESSVELCRREGIVQNLYYRWSKDFLEAGKKLAGLICFDVNGMQPKTVVKRLLQHRIVASTTPYGTSYARLAPSLVNTPKEVDATLRAIRAMAYG
jgi:transposase-like protein